MSEEGLKLNLGSGGKKVQGYVNIDAQPMEEPDIVCDLSRERWPFEDNTCIKAMASHVLEHLGPGPEPYFHFMKELWRVCQHGALVLIIVPHPRHDVYLNDPTHQHPVTPDSLGLFSRKRLEAKLAEGIQLTPFWKYLGIDFDIVPPVRYVLDPKIGELVKEDPDYDWKTREEHEANIVVEYQLVLRAVKNEEGDEHVDS